jgi:outer membrane lipoprotein SlyB
MRRGIASLVIGALLVSGCATTAPSPQAGPAAKPGTVKEWMQSRSKKGAVIGFIAGALVGAATAALTGGNGDDVVAHALAGGVVGAVAGFAVGKRQDRVYEHRDFAIRRTGYDSSQGYIAQVEEVAFRPSQPKPGSVATLTVRYIVIGPDPKEKIAVKMFRGLKYGDTYLFGAGPNVFLVPRGGGMVEASMEVTLPKKAPQGTYSVEALIEDPKGRFPDSIATNALYVVARAQDRGVESVAP